MQRSSQACSACYNARVVLKDWTAHPAKERPRDVALVVAVVSLTAGAVLMSLQSLFLTGLAVVILIVAVAPFLFPTRYVITDVDVSERRLWVYKSRQWKDLRRIQAGQGAVLVSPFASPSWMDRYRGLILMYGDNDRDELVRLIEQQVAATRQADAV